MANVHNRTNSRRRVFFNFIISYVLSQQKFKNRKAYGIKNNAITKFAEAYVIDMGHGPFSKKHTGGAAGGAKPE